MDNEIINVIYFPICEILRDAGRSSVSIYYNILWLLSNSNIRTNAENTLPLFRHSFRIIYFSDEPFVSPILFSSSSDK